MEQIFSQAWEHFSKHWKFLSLASGIGIFLPMLLMFVPYIIMMASVIGMQHDFQHGGNADPNLFAGGMITSMILMFVLMFIIIIASTITQVGLMKCAIIITNGGTPTRRDLFLDTNTYLKGFGAAVLCGFMMVAGIGICFIPGIVIAFFVALTPFEIISNPNTGIFEAIKKSFNLVGSDLKTSVVVMLLSGIISSIVSSATGGLGMIPAYPFMFLTQAVLYQHLKSNMQPPANNNVPPQDNAPAPMFPPQY